MRHSLALLLAALLGFPASAQVRDFYDDKGNIALGIWDASGWMCDLTGELLPEIIYATDGTSPAMYFAVESRISMVLAEIDPLGVQNIRYHQFDITSHGELAHAVEPERVGDARPDYRNIYRTENMPYGAEQVQAYDEIAYYGAFDDVDLHFYNASSGYRWAIVCHPGSEPAEVKFHVGGADSLDIDYEGHLNLWKEGHYARFDKAVAYQIDANDDVVPMNWTPSYEEVDDDVVVGFNVDSYDPALPLILLIGPPPRTAASAGGGTPPCWGTYFGTSLGEKVVASETDADGNYYVSGVSTNPYSSFPNVLGGGSVNGLGVSGTYKYFLTKFNPSHVLLWSSMVCPFASLAAAPHAIAVKESPERAIYIAGNTRNPDIFYTGQSGAFIDSVGTNGIANACIAKFDSSGFCLWSTFFVEAEATITGLAVDSQDRLWATGWATGGLPTPPGGQLAVPRCGLMPVERRMLSGRSSTLTIRLS